MNSQESIAHIEMLKYLWFKYNKTFCNKHTHWCLSHEKLPYNIGGYMAWPVLMDDKNVNKNIISSSS